MFFRFLARRLVQSLLVLLGVLVVIWIMVNQIGDPARLIIPADASEELYLAARKSLGLDDPFLVRFWHSFSGWLVGDFGDSLWQHVPALPLVLGRLPATLLLTVVTLSLAIPIAVFVGVLSALYPGSPIDRALTVISLAGVSIADFWLGLMLILLFAVELSLLPTSGYGGPQYLVLPVLTLILRPIGRIAQVARSALVDEMQKPYIVTLRSQGMSESQIVRNHALKNCAISITTVAGDELTGFLNGAVVIEVIFAWPGVGSLLIQAIERRDLPLILASVFVVATIVILINLIIDIIYARLDPRATLTATRGSRRRRRLGALEAARPLAGTGIARQ